MKCLLDEPGNSGPIVSVAPSPSTLKQISRCVGTFQGRNKLPQGCLLNVIKVHAAKSCSAIWQRKSHVGAIGLSID